MVFLASGALLLVEYLTIFKVILDSVMIVDYIRVAGMLLQQHDSDEVTINVINRLTREINSNIFY